MATIRPISFPHVAKTTVQRPRVQKTQPQQPAAMQPVNKPAVQPASKATGRRATAGQLAAKTSQAQSAQNNREQTLAAAIAVLEQKTAQLYHPNKTKSSGPPQLGQFIDVKA